MENHFTYKSEIMTEKNEIKLFQNKEIRTKWNKEKEEYYFSIIDIISVLTESSRPEKYWSDLKSKLKKEGSELSENIGRLKLPAKDGKMRLTDVGTTKDILRLIQSVPSPNAEPFKQWLAQVGQERLEEIADPEKAMERAIETYRRKGYEEEWIDQRIKSIGIRKDLTAEWNRSGVKYGKEYAILTDEITKAWSDKSVKQYKQHKGLKKESLRDNMTNMELILNMLAEATTTEISKTENPRGFDESKKIAKEGGTIAGNTRKEIEKRTGRKIVSNKNAEDSNLLEE